ncbi:putative RNase H [Lyophyllum shimeji]|uniref:ribonuclease H n=1 Tax=Lyophyllum shimeji TaxID=47721 RepID=A0A9P3PJ30_LYOSH|nr:putative RNase H [Lyophyllum shimeji]
MNPASVPLPLCRRFVPDTEDEEDALLLSACASSKTPEAMFPPRTGGMRRYIHARDPRMLLLQTAGACLDNGLPQHRLRAGAAFVFGPTKTNPNNAEAEQGVSGMVLGPQDASSSRAELVAVIAALRARHWLAEGFDKVVVATNSEYAVNGCTEWCRAWEAREWRTSRGRPVRNRDLWEELICLIESIRRWGSEVFFWQIPSQWNAKADAAAKEAAEMGQETSR